MTVTAPAPAAGGRNAAPIARPGLPSPRGPVSEALIAYLNGHTQLLPPGEDADPWSGDAQLALHLSYELHYRGLPGVADDLEWDLPVLALRRRLEERFLAALREEVAGGADLDAELTSLTTEHLDAEGTSHHLMRTGTAEQFREYVAMRSVYHLKEADPQAWVIPRLEGAAKSAVVAVEHDEYGAGRVERMHAALYAAMMRELGLDDAYGAYVDCAPASVLADVNLMSLCGLRRSLRGAAIGQFAVVELTSSPGSARLVKAARRLGLGPATERFYAEHVAAAAVHEQVLRHDVLAPLVAAEPELVPSIVFGIQASDVVAGRFVTETLGAWRTGESALHSPT